MEQIKIHLKFIDVVKADKYLPVFLAIGGAFAFYRGADISGVLIYGLPAMVLIMLFVWTFEALMPCLTINAVGLEFTASNFRRVTTKWESPITIDSVRKGKYKCKKITDVETGNSVFVPSVVFSYPEVRVFLKKYIPDNHPLLTCIPFGEN